MGGNNKIFNNSEIRTVINLSHDTSMAIIEVKITHEEYQKANKLINDNLERWAKENPRYLDGPTNLGISDFHDFGLTFKLKANASEDDRFQAERDMRKQVKELFDANGIKFAITKVIVTSEDAK